METITLYYSLSGRLVDESGNPLGADARPELTAGVTYEVELIPVAGASPAGTYTLSADLDFRRTNLMVQSTVTVATSSEDGTVTFDAVSTDTNGFWTKPRQPGTKLYLRVTVSAGGVERSVIDDYIYCRPGVAGSDDHPAPNEGAVTKLNGLTGQVVIKDAAGEALAAANGVITLPEIDPGVSVNGLSGPVVLADADGNPLPVDGQKILIETGGTGFDGLYPDRNPVAQIPVLDATLGVCHYLDATFTEIDFSYPVWHLVEIRALVRSVNAAITGTVEITPYIDDVAQAPVTINVGATWAAAVIPLVVETGAVRIVRTGGTLADGSWVGAAFRGITAMVTL